MGTKVREGLTNNIRYFKKSRWGMLAETKPLDLVVGTPFLPFIVTKVN